MTTTIRKSWRFSARISKKVKALEVVVSRKEVEDTAHRTELYRIIVSKAESVSRATS